MPMTDAQVQARFQVLGEELRCLVCQNQTLADSNADLARDLRTEVEEQIRAGKSDQQIKDYLVARYGDFVLYRPQVKRETWLLWAGPFALLGGGALAWVLTRRQRASSRAAAAAGGPGKSARMSAEAAEKLLRDDR